jgi:hypothetical protein
MDDFSCVAGNSKQPPDEKTGNGQPLCYNQLKTAIRQENWQWTTYLVLRTTQKAIRQGNLQWTTYFMLQATENSHSTRKLAMDNLFYVISN